MKNIRVSLVVVGLLCFFVFSYNFLIQHRFYFKPVVNYIVNKSLISCDGRKGCTEVRPVPKPLQGKKFVFGTSTDIFFEPYSKLTDIDRSEFDTLGFLDADPRYNRKPPSDFINPSLNKRGYLQEREYKIIRTMYHYNCAICIDSSDYAFIVIEDKKGNRFVSMLNEYDSTKTPGQKLTWDEYLPYFMAKDTDGNQRVDVQLIPN